MRTLRIENRKKTYNLDNIQLFHDLVGPDVIDAVMPVIFLSPNITLRSDAYSSQEGLQNIPMAILEFLA